MSLDRSDPTDAAAKPHRLSWARLAAWALWTATIVVCSIRVLAQAEPRGTVYPVFAEAGRNWLEGNSLYGSSQFLFRYSPAVAAAFSTLTYLPDSVGDFFWRLFNAVVFIAGFGWWTSLVAKDEDHRSRLWLLALPLCLSSFGNGQANPLLLGLLLLAASSIVDGRCKTAGFALACGIVLKIYPVAFALLLAIAAGRRLLFVTVVATLALLAMPFLVADADYVAGQFTEWQSFLRADARVDWDWQCANRDVWLLARRIGAPLSFVEYQLATVAVGFGLAALAAIRVAYGHVSGESKRQTLLLFVPFAACFWMTVFGPATEACTYILAAPYFAVVCDDALMRRIANRRLWMVVPGAVLLLIAEMANLFPWAATFHSYGPHPAGALLLFGDFVLVSIAELRGLPLTKLRSRQVISRTSSLNVGV